MMAFSKMIMNKMTNANLDMNSIIYHNNKKLIKQDYKSLWIEVECIQVTLSRLSKINLNFNYIGLCIKQNVCLPALVLGCIKFEKPFVCLDIENSLEFNVNLIKNLGVAMMFSDYGDHEQLKCIMKSPCLLEEFSLWDVKIQLWKTGEAVAQTVTKPAMMYAIQTSGSTGKPKIIQVPEQAILPNISDLRKKWTVKKDDVILLASPPTFDPFMVELLLAVSSEAALLVVPTQVRVSPHHLLDAVFPSDSKPLITIAQLTPSMFTCWTSHQIKTRVLTRDTSLRILALGGERFPPEEFWSQCRAEDNVTEVYSLYGTTELSCWAMIGPGSDNILGTALSHTKLWVEAEDGETVVNGTGQLYIGSETRICLVGSESWEQLQPPVYRATGDLVSVNSGRYHYVGRKDNLVKRWGHRVSLDHIEAIAVEYPNVIAACCVLHADVLGLFVCLHPHCPDVDSVKAHLRNMFMNRLNKASLPDVILAIDHIPLNRHGKTNRNKLKQMLSELSNKEISFSDSVELFQALWKKYTSQELPESRERGFISEGGNSVAAMLIINSMSVQGHNLSTAVLSRMLNNGSLAECCRLMGSHPAESLVSLTVLDGGPIVKKRKTDCESEILFVKMKGSTNNLMEDIGNDLELRIAWSHNLGRCVDSSPTCIVYNNGTRLAVVGSHSGKLAALDVDSGSLLWEVQLPDRIESSITPSPCGSRALLGCYDGCVYCISLVSGQVLWSFKTKAMIKGTALSVGENWVVGSYDYCVYCLHSLDGCLVWKQKMDGIVLATPLHLSSEGLLVVATLTGTVAALGGNTGHVSWRTSLPSPVFSSPCTVGGEIVVAEVDGMIHGLQASSGVKVWQFKAGGKIFSSLLSWEDSVVFGCHDNSVYLVRCPLSTREPVLVWRQATGSATYATPVMLTIHHLVTADTAGLISVLDTLSGAVVCSFHLPGQAFSSPVSCGNSVVIGCRDDNVYCLKVNKK